MGRSSYRTFRGKPAGSHMIGYGSLMNSSVTARGPFPGLMSLSLSSAQGVKGAATCPTPAVPAAPASQVPVRLRGGAGDGFADGCEAFRGNPGLFQVCESMTPDEHI